jgi:DNA-binding NarL/FixJ family response regulator
MIKQTREVQAMTPAFFTNTLLVEDQGLTREALKTLLIQCDPRLEIDEANDYQSSIKLLHARKYDLLFLDFHLGAGCSGLDVLKWIRENSIGLHTVMLSAQDDKDTVLECIKAGASGFISKSSESARDEVKTALDTILSGQIYLPKSTFGKGGYSPTSQASKPTTIAPRLEQTLKFVCQGLSNKEIATRANLSEQTVKEYVSDLLRSFGVRRRTELIVEMARRGIVIPR